MLQNFKLSRGQPSRKISLPLANLTHDGQVGNCLHVFLTLLFVNLILSYLYFAEQTFYWHFCITPSGRRNLSKDRLTDMRDNYALILMSLFQLILTDRSLMPGDVVRRLISEKDSQRGFVESISAKCHVKILGTEQWIYNVDVADITTLQVCVIYTYCILVYLLDSLVTCQRTP